MIKRESYLKKIRPFIGKDLVKVLTGMRRSGKSTLLKLIQAELVNQGTPTSQFYAINFESLIWANATTVGTYQEITDFAKSHPGKIYLFFDEIQELPEWERLINSLRVDLDCDIYITGSNSKLLSGELATYLAGRYIEIAVYPFSFQEIVAIEQGKHPQKKREALFQTYLRWGGLPFIYENQLDDQAALDYLNDIYNSILLKDIVARHAIRDVELFERVMAYLLANVGHTFSGVSLMKYLKNEGRTLSQETIYNFIAYAQTACLLHMVPREDVQGKRLLKFQEKIYLADPGIRETVYGNNLRDLNQILENIVYLELLRRGFTVLIGKSGVQEIDFVALNKSQRLYIQVAYLLADESVIQREFSALTGIPDQFPKLVLSLDSFDFSRDGINHQNLIDFLMTPDESL